MTHEGIFQHRFVRLHEIFLYGCGILYKEVQVRQRAG